MSSSHLCSGAGLQQIERTPLKSRLPSTPKFSVSFLGFDLALDRKVTQEYLEKGSSVHYLLSAFSYVWL